MVFGYSYEYIDEFFTLPRLAEVYSYWGRNPPIHKMIAAYLGIKPEAAPTSETLSEADYIESLKQNG